MAFMAFECHGKQAVGVSSHTRSNHLADITTSSVAIFRREVMQR